MSVSTNGQICFGVMFEEGFEFPWEDYEEEEWWRKVKGYRPAFEIYNAQGEYLNGVEPAKKKIDEFYEHRSQWESANPFPIEIVNYCSGDCPMFILAVKSSVVTNRRGYPEEFDPAKLTVTDEEVKVLLDFIRDHIEDAPDAEPKWYLSSYWG